VPVPVSEWETVRALAAAGADVTLAVRDTDAGAAVAARLRDELPASAGTLTVGRIELSDLASVAAFTAEWSGPLHILVNNAGVMSPPQITRTLEGREWQFGVNHLGHFALATGLHPALAAAGDARVVAVSSIGHLFSPASSTTWTTATAPTTSGRPTASPRPPPPCSPSAPPNAGPTTGSPPTP